MVTSTAPTIVVFHLDNLQPLTKTRRLDSYSMFRISPWLFLLGERNFLIGRARKSSHLSRAFLISDRFVRCDQYVDVPIVVMVRDKFVLWEKLLAEAYGDYFD